jgi:hypothetical protein
MRSGEIEKILEELKRLKDRLPAGSTIEGIIEKAKRLEFRISKRSGRHGEDAENGKTEPEKHRGDD